MNMLPPALRDATMEACQPWARFDLTALQWSALARDPVTLLSAWADTARVYALYRHRPSGLILPVSVAPDDGSYPALSIWHPVAAWYERTIHDLWGHVPAGGDTRPWLDHGHWPQTAVMAARPGPPSVAAEPPEFQEVGDGTFMQWPIGPLTAGIGEAGHLRLTLDGTRIVRAESRLGYTHKGTLLLMRGKSPRVAARFAARLAGDATVAHSVAFAVATEMALTLQAPPRAVALRSLMGGLERIATLLDDLTSLAGLLGDARAHGYCGEQQEYVRRGLAGAFGHRLMMDGVVPGGVAGEPDANGLSVLRQVLDGLAESLLAIRRLFGNGLLAARLSGRGVADRQLVETLGVEGIVAEAGRFGGDAAARCRARLDAIARDTEACIGLLSALPEGPLAIALPANSGEGIGYAASARGTVWHWLRLDHGQIAAVFPTDPGWALWPLAEATLAGAAAGDAAAIQCSLGLPVSGMDL